MNTFQKKLVTISGGALVTAGLVLAGGVTSTASAVAPAAPTVTSATPASPSNSLAPKVKGTAEALSTVTLYNSSTCTGAAIGTGTAADFTTGAGITATVVANATTTIYATATNAASEVSSCSSTAFSYVNDSIAPAAPTALTLTVASPSTVLTPSVKGTADANSTVSLYATATCTGTPLATGTAAAFATPGLPITVVAGSVNTIKATAKDAAGNVSACSTAQVVYTNAAETTITKKPASKVKLKATKRKAKVVFQFSSGTVGATFQCSIDGRAFVPCASSGVKLKAKAGKHTFAVRAVINGVADATPATASFKVVKRQIKK